MVLFASFKKVDHIVVLKDGRVSEQGSYSELLSNKGDFADFLLEYMVGGDETEELGDIVGDLQQGAIQWEFEDTISQNGLWKRPNKNG